ncbi:MAG: hypothetical protein Q9191_006404 [Dirinaria sp. TL-2023a]
MAPYDAEELMTKFIDIRTKTIPSLSKPEFLGRAETQKLATERANAVFTHRAAILAILDRYEETLGKRWRNKSIELRRKVLMSAYPTMPSHHRPDFEAIRTESPAQTILATRFPEAFSLPSLNMEDLTKPKSLLMLLNSRGRHDPALFDYGQLVSWNARPGIYQMMWQGIGIQPGEGLIVLEIQRRILDFLQRCAEDLPLHDTRIPVQPSIKTSEPNAATIKQGLMSSSLLEETMEAPYSVPGLDLDRLGSFLSAKRDEAEDHIWSLREDPSYFRYCIGVSSEHQEVQIAGVDGSKHPMLGTTKFWDFLLKQAVLDAYMVFASWDDLYQAANQLISLRSQYASEIQPSMPLPTEYDVALCHFSFSVDQLVEGTLTIYKRAMMASPGLRGHYASRTQNWKGNTIEVVAKANSRKKDKFRWHLEQLFMLDQVSLHGLEVLSDNAERVILDPGNRVDRARVSPYVASILSDLSLLGEIRRQLGLLRPGIPMTEPIRCADQLKAFIQRMELNGRLKTAFEEGIQLSAVGTPLAKFTYPLDKPLNAKTTRILQEAERNLDRFWNKVDSHIIQHGGTSLHTKLINIIRIREIRRTPDWKDVNSEVRKLDKALEELSVKTTLLELEARTENTVSHTTQQLPVPKVKTRGTAS